MRDGSAPHDFKNLFEPRSIAIVGASATASSPGNRLIGILKNSGFAGNVYPVHPKATTIDGLKAYPSLRDLPETVDYAFVCVGAEAVPGLVDAARGRVRFMQVMTSGFGEIAEGASLQSRLSHAVENSDLRLLGPNCIGIHSGRGRVSFIENTDFSPGGISVVSQSGGLSIDILRGGQQIGLRFNCVVSVGNSLDVGATELLGHLLEDPATEVIGLYIESVSHGRRLFELLRDGNARKPVVLLKGGMTGEGLKAAASHTGSIADDQRTWRALAQQTGVILVDALGEFLGLLQLFQAYPPISGLSGKDVVLIGNGGGASVLAADHFSRQGSALHRFGQEAKARLAALELPPGSSFENPMDVPANAMRRNGGKVIADILEVAADQSGIGAFVMHLNLTVLSAYDSETIIGNALDALITVRRRLADRAQVVLVLRSDYSVVSAEQALICRRKAALAEIPVFDELPETAKILGAYERFAAFRHKRQAPAGEGAGP
jgi:acyl-CoA synthetase (NDP forming)